jgi:hypothetical protein
MTNTTFSATTLEGLCDQYKAFCDRHQLPPISADELLLELYGEEPRRDELCGQVKEFIAIWDEVCDAKVTAE